MAPPPYTIAEDKKIINYILETESFNNLRGNAFWKELDGTGILDRTWQSMKERFRKTIINNLHLYNLPRDQYTILRAGYSQSAKRNWQQTVKDPEIFIDDIPEMED